MWTATINSKSIDNGMITVQVLYTDGTNEYACNYSQDGSGDDSLWLEKQVKNRLARLEAVSQKFAAVEVGSVVDVSKVNNETPVTPEGEVVVDVG